MAPHQHRHGSYRARLSYSAIARSIRLVAPSRRMPALSPSSPQAPTPREWHQCHHGPGPAGQARCRGMVLAPVAGEDLERTHQAFRRRVEHRHRPLQIRAEKVTHTQPDQGQPGTDQDPPHHRPGRGPARSQGERPGLINAGHDLRAARGGDLIPGHRLSPVPCRRPQVILAEPAHRSRRLPPDAVKTALPPARPGAPGQFRQLMPSNGGAHS